jgi:sugar/nucleoside kinase (ribokinase family)
MHWPIRLPAPTSGGPDLVVLGENSLDFVAVAREPVSLSGKHPLAAFEMYPGGQAATAAVGCARQGLQVVYVGVLGADDWGRRVRDALVAESVDVVAVEVPDVRNRIAVVIVDATGERTVLELRDGALAEFRVADLAAQAANGRLLLEDATLLPLSIAAARAARARGIPTLVDVDRVEPRTIELLRLIDVLVAPEPFVRAFTGVQPVGAGLRSLAAASGSPVVIATLAERGSLALIGGREIRTPGFEVPVVDTTGAGDAFRAGLASAWIRSGETVEAEDLLRWANATAALNCMAVGAQTALPTAAAVNRLVTDGRDAGLNERGEVSVAHDREQTRGGQRLDGTMGRGSGRGAN